MKRWRDVLLSTDKTVKLPDHLGATWLRLAIECGKNLFEAAEKVGFKQHAEEIHSDKNCRCAERMAVQAMHPRGSFCAPEMGKWLFPFLIYCIWIIYYYLKYIQMQI